MQSIKIKLGKAISKIHTSFQHHTEDFYQRNGKCQRCGLEAGPFTPLKLWEVITGMGCKKE